MAYGTGYGASYGTAFRAGKNREQQDPFYDPKREESLLRSIANKGASGLSAVGNILDIPGSVVRDVVGGVSTGNWSKYNPFDQLAPWNWTKADERVEGRELLRDWGVVGKKDDWGNFGAGLASEILLDPLTYMTFGGSALGKGGKIVKGAGAWDDALKMSGKGKSAFRTTSTFEDVVKGFKIQAAEGGESAARATEKLLDLTNRARGLGFPNLDQAVQAVGKERLGNIAQFELPGFGKPLWSYSGAKASAPLDAASEAIRQKASDLTKAAGLEGAVKYTSDLGKAISNITKPKPMPNRQRAIELAVKVMGPEEAYAGMAVWDAAANTAYRRKKIKSPDEFFSKLTDIRRRKPEDLGADTLFQSSQQPWYSVTRKTVEGIKQPKVTKDQLLGILRKTAKQEEIELANFDELFEGRKSVPKQEILDHIDAHGVELEETWLADEVPKELIDKYVEQVSTDFTFEDTGNGIRLFDEGGEQWSPTDPSLAHPSSPDLYRDMQTAKEEVYAIYSASAQHDIEGGFLNKIVDESGYKGTYAGPAKWANHEGEQLVIPGGTNQRELLIRMPQSEKSKLAYQVESLLRQIGSSDIDPKWGVKSLQERDNLIYAEVDRLNEEMAKLPEDRLFTSHHWDDPNVVAHVRMNDRVGPNGEKILHVEEIQSDWHQAGREKGYWSGKTEKVETGKWRVIQKDLQQGTEIPYEFDSKKEAGEFFAKLTDESGKSKVQGHEFSVEPIVKEVPVVSTKGHSVINEIDGPGRKSFTVKAPDKSTFVEYADTAEEAMKQVAARRAVPDAPWKDRSAWSMLAFKRVLRDAIENGYDEITWTTGKQQADRYSLTRVIDKINWQKYKDEVQVDLVGKDGNSINEHVAIQGGFLQADDSTNAVVVPKDQLHEVVGREMADKILNEEKNGGTFRGAELEIGGEFHKQLYDKEIPNNVQKYVKKWGGKVETGGVRNGNEYITLNGQDISQSLKYNATWPDRRQLSTMWQAIESGDAAKFDTIKSVMLEDASTFLAGAKHYAKQMPHETSHAKIAKEMEQNIKVLENAKFSDFAIHQETIPVHRLKITPKMKEEILGKGQPLFQNQQSPRGAVEFAQDGSAIIHLFQNADKSTFMHESAHIFRRMLGEIDPELLQDASKALGVSADIWGTGTEAARAAEEAFAEGFENYLATGKAPHKSLKAVFEQFAKWLTDVYKGIVNSPLQNQINPELRAVFDTMLQEGTGDLALAMKKGQQASAASKAAKAMGYQDLDQATEELSKQKIPLSGKDIASKPSEILDTVGEAVRYGQYSPIRPVMGLFDNRNKGMVQASTQKIAQDVHRAEREAIETARGYIAPMVREFHNSPLFDITKVDEKVAAENRGKLMRYMERVSTHKNPSWDLPNTPEWNKIKPHAEAMKDAFAQMLQNERAAGLNTKQLQDEFIEYVARRGYFFETPEPRSGFVRRLFHTTHPGMKTRREYGRDVPGGTALLNEMSLDTDISGYVKREGRTGKMTPENLEHIKQIIEDRYLEDLVHVTGDLESFDSEDITQLARWVGNLDPRHAKLQIPAYEQNLLEGFQKRLENSIKTTSAAYGVHDTIALNAIPFTDFDRKTVGMPNAKELLKKAKIDGEQAEQVLFDRMGQMGRNVLKSLQDKEAMVLQRQLGDLTRAEIDEAIENAGYVVDAKLRSTDEAVQVMNIAGDQAIVRGAGEVDRVVPMKDLTTTKEIGVGDALEQIFVPAEVAADVEKYFKTFAAPEALKPFLNAYDKFTNMFKGSVTSLFPAFHSRNFVSGAFQNFIGRAYDPLAPFHEQYFRPLKDAWSLLRGKEVSNVTKIPYIESKGITNAKEATEEIANLAFAHGIVGEHLGQAGELLGDVNSRQVSQLPGLDTAIFRKADPGSKPAPGTPKFEAILETIANEWNPLNMRGVLTDKSTFRPAMIGEDVGSLVENVNRMSPFIAFLKQGMSPAEAARRVKLLQVDYGQLTHFERGTMRRLFPFWSFSKGILPVVVEELTQHPGGRLAQTIRASRLAKGGDTNIKPDYVGETASIHLGQLPDGSDRYITGLGLMHEDPLSFLGGGLRGGLLEAASRVNPIPKAPLEWMTNQTFFQKGPQGGRPLEELDPTLGRTVANIKELATGQKTPRAEPLLGNRGLEFLVANSPLARVTTTARQITDPRKLDNPLAAFLNLGTGVRVADISPAARDAILREKVAELMKDEGAKTFMRTYIPKEEKEKMSPAQRQRAELYELVMKQLAEEAKARKKEREAVK